MTDQHSFVIKKYSAYAPVILRVIVGYGFVVHGWAKLSRGPASFEKLLVVLHVPFAHFFSWLVPLTELFGGLMLILGFFADLAILPLIITMLVAIYTIHIKFGFSSINTIGLTPQGPLFGPPGIEIDLLYIAALISLLLTGTSVLSLDAAIRKKGIPKADNIA